MSQNPRYLAYCRAHGRSPDAMGAYDRERYPGGCMVGFVLWNTDMLREFSREAPDAFVYGGLVDGARYDAWLDARASTLAGAERQED